MCSRSDGRRYPLADPPIHCNLYGNAEPVWEHQCKDVYTHVSICIYLCIPTMAQYLGFRVALKPQLDIIPVSGLPIHEIGQCEELFLQPRGVNNYFVLSSLRADLCPAIPFTVCWGKIAGLLTQDLGSRPF
jgi:hypothetical protein